MSRPPPIISINNAPYLTLPSPSLTLPLPTSAAYIPISPHPPIFLSTQSRALHPSRTHRSTVLLPMPTMEPSTPSTPTSDSHPSIPVSHPRSSPHSSTPPQPPISPPRYFGVTTTSTQLTSSGSPVTSLPLAEAAAPPTSPATLSHSVPGAQVDPERHCVTKADPEEVRVPNVYINGLPPNFPEEQLYAITKEFGGVISVRTFTRHVSDRPSYVYCNP